MTKRERRCASRRFTDLVGQTKKTREHVASGARFFRRQPTVAEADEACLYAIERAEYVRIGSCGLVSDGKWNKTVSACFDLHEKVKECGRLAMFMGDDKRSGARYYLNWLQGRFMEIAFCEMFAQHMFPGALFRMAGADADPSSLLFSRDHSADIEVSVEESTIMVEVQSGSQSRFSDVKGGKIEEAVKRAVSGVETVLVHFDIVGNSVAVVRNLANARCGSRRAQWGGRAVWEIPDRFFHELCSHPFPSWPSIPSPGKEKQLCTG